MILYLIYKNKNKTKMAEDSRKKAPLWWVSFLSGLAGGVGDTLFNYPPYGIHIRKERKDDLKWWKSSPRMIYCGATAYGLGMIPSTIIQLSITDYTHEYLPRNIAAFLGGISGALFYTPVGNIIVNQQKLMPLGIRVTPDTYIGMGKSISYIINTYGYKRFYTGLGPTMIRDGIYSTSVFSVTGSLKNKYSYIQNEHIKNIAIAIVLGSITSFLSHPFDAIATRMQDHEGKISYMNIIKKMWNTEETTYKFQKIKTFYRGAAYRCYAVIAGILVVENISSFTSDRLMKKLNDDI